MLVRKTLIAAAMILVLASLALTAPALAADGENEHRLTLADALRLGLENNLDLVSARYSPAMAEQDIETQLSNFDIGLQAQVSHNESIQAATQASTLSGSTRDNGNVGIQQNLKFGGNYSASLSSTRQEQSGANVLAPTSYFTTLGMGFTIPLMKGFGVDDTTTQLILSRSALDTSIRDLEGQAETVLQSVEGAYWDLKASREALRISRLSLKRAEDQLAQNRRKVEVGTLAPIEITQAEAQVASQEEGVILSETGLLDAQDELLRLLAVPESDPMWAAVILPVDVPEFKDVEVDLAASLELAFTSRPDLYAARQAIQDRQLNEKVARRGVRHQLDLNGGYNPTGSSLPDIDFSDPLNPIVIANPSLGDSFSALPDLDDYSWNAQLTYRVPLGNRAAKADYARAQLSRRRADTDLLNLEQSVRVEVRRAARAVESGMKRVRAARVNTNLQQKKLEAEQKKFENGMSTSFEVLTFQDDLASAELAQVRALLDYLKALVALEKSQGTLLEKHGLSL
jgi:outer membrane protein